MNRISFASTSVIRFLRWALLTIAFVTAAIPSFSQDTNQVQSESAQSDPPAAPIVKASTLPANMYEFPDGKQQFRNYLNSAFGPVAFVRAAVGAGLDQSKPAPPEWDPGAEGFGERYGFRLGMGVMTETVKYSSGALLRQDVAYHRCECGGFLPRTAHVIASPFVARAKSGRTVLFLPAIGASYAGSFAAVNAWYPARYGAQDATRLGSYSFALNMGANLVREFFLPRR